FPVPNMAVYSASKAYVTNFSEALRMELRPLGISVTALCPGPVPTEFFAVAQRPGSDFQESPFTTPEFLLTSAAEVVAEGLRAVANDRPRSIPNPFLWLLITLALALPICLLRILISCYINRKNR
ncbi:MAG: SDR family NAD(P)-dependent oxidoreductase, partial [Chthoniobacterales bacterium]|nr:SDR family NAD(P)-dependent oxidoreductase [Chthoniobacterales bacterium]